MRPSSVPLSRVRCKLELVRGLGPPVRALPDSQAVGRLSSKWRVDLGPPEKSLKALRRLSLVRAGSCTSCPGGGPLKLVKGASLRSPPWSRLKALNI